MREIALHLLDIVENSVAAHSRNICIEVHENHPSDLLLAKVTDDGDGMDEKTAHQILDPFYTTRTTRKVGLGIPLLKLAAEMAGGGLSLITEAGRGTRVEASFRFTHIDRMPLGDLAVTFLTLLVSHPHIHWTFIYQVQSEDGQWSKFKFDDVETKAVLGDVPLTEPQVLRHLRTMFEEGVSAPSLQPVN
ncbi:MAG: ATP-binding protein [Chloroflexi bacterium]|nr:ATP-binding protein [Chloroflexota bacterium]